MLCINVLNIYMGGLKTLRQDSQLLHLVKHAFSFRPSLPAALSPFLALSTSSTTLGRPLHVSLQSFYRR